MTHQRQKIRETFKATLIGNTAVDQNVYESRTRPLWDKKFFSQLPAILIYTRNTRSEVFNEAVRVYDHKVTVDVEIVAEANADLDDLMDSIAEEVENLMYQNNILYDGTDCWADETILQGTEQQLTPPNQGKTVYGSTKLEWEVSYQQEAPEADVNALDDLITVDTKYNLDADQDPDDRAEDFITGLDT